MGMNGVDSGWHILIYCASLLVLMKDWLYCGHFHRVLTGKTVKTSQRSDISPFIVMDVVRAAAEREAQGESVFHP